ncbi:hypothetical protein [Stratiformator vulcanicus]|uniref:Uncharacterized protein n=1 Tax=Stratiformator vulcanicus TaxID=2527980 RepID=A0A517R647_9PLAN|nr:hypothetical protein [Stratiformator vulcanicus]QDT39340.1 hypothetical protein Pan189_37460 [Stratiformator vulcanicus]
MSDFYVLRDYFGAGRNFTELDYHEPLQLTDDVVSCFVAGEPLPENYPLLKIGLKVKGFGVPQAMQPGYYLAMHESLVRCISSVGESHVQIKPCRLENAKNQEKIDDENFRHVHLLSPLPQFEFLDVDRCRVEYGHGPKDLRRVDTLVLFEHRVPADRHIFKLTRMPIIFVRRRLRDLMLTAGLPELALEPIEEYRGDEIYPYLDHPIYQE